MNAFGWYWLACFFAAPTLLLLAIVFAIGWWVDSRGRDRDQEQHQALIDLHNQLVAEHNELRAEHHALIRTNRAEVHDLNMLRDWFALDINNIPRQRSES
jgi:hypothetical protein